MPGNKKNKNSNFIVQGGILAIAGLITRIIGMIYRIPVTNIIGDQGNGYYAGAYYVYNIMLLISSYSLPIAISKIVSTRRSKNQYRNASKVFNGGLIFAFISGGIVCLAVWFGSNVFAALLNEPLSAIALRIFAPTLLVVAIMGVIRGYFQGMGTMIPTAVSQIIEQIINAVVSIIAAKMLFDYGKKVAALLHNDNFAPAYGAAGSTLGTSLGAFVALLFLIVLLLMINSRLRREKMDDTTKYTEDYSDVFRIIILTVLPVILSTAIYNINDILDNIIFNRLMTANGLASEKTAIWGIYTGKAKLLLNVPIALANSMSASSVPALAACVAANNLRGARKKVSAAMRFTMIISFPCATGLFVLADPIVKMLFTGDPSKAAAYIRAGALSVIFYSISTLLNGILQGIGKMKLPVRNAAISLSVHIVLLYVLMSRFKMGIYAVIISITAFSLIMSILNAFCVKKELKYRQEIAMTFIIPSISSVVMGIVIFVLYRLLNLFLGNIISTLIAIIIGSLVYFVCILKLRGIREDEMYDLPMGKRLVTFAKKLNLL